MENFTLEASDKHLENIWKIVASLECKRTGRVAWFEWDAAHVARNPEVVCTMEMQGESTALVSHPMAYVTGCLRHRVASQR